MHQIVGFVVEDNQDIAHLVGRAFAIHKIEVHTALDGDTALSWLMEHEPDIVVLDLQLPGVSGLDILNYMQCEARLNNTTVVVFTANYNMVPSAKLQGASLILPKPISFQELASVIGKIAAKYREE